MHAQKIAKVSSARAMTLAMMDRSREEALLLEGWATSDSARTMDDADWDESQDRSDIASIAPRRAYDA